MVDCAHSVRDFAAIRAHVKVVPVQRVELQKRRKQRLDVVDVAQSEECHLPHTEELDSYYLVAEHPEREDGVGQSLTNQVCDVKLGDL